MKIKSAPMGPYQTNCYIATVDGKDFIIDPGVDATSWVLKNTKNPIAILNTHGHFDHVWSNKELKEKLNIPIYCPKGDCFMLENDPFSQGTPSSKADIQVTGDMQYNIDGVKISFHHFAGHTPGCSAIAIEDCLFSGDFIFQNSIGRVDFPYSNPNDMKKSINKILKWTKDFKIYPGHGASTTLKQEKSSLKNWLNYI
ncbi:MAG: MBL fold metallo-hydrolase [Campylobacterota bacterium]|nr:MBL fold metallo-hydrolase [Campylobacterota bacterium]